MGPLREIIGYYINKHGVEVEVLECGHAQNRKQDAYGYTTAYRRRCRKCEDK